MPASLCRRLPLAWLAVAAAVAAGSAAAAETAVTVTTGPYVQHFGNGWATIHYETDARADGYVRYGTGGVLDRVAPAELHQQVQFDEYSKDGARTVRSAWLYRVRLGGLEPGTEYQYQVVPAGVVRHSALAVRSFRTLPASAGRVTFIAYGDSRTQTRKHREVVRNFLKHDPAFILHTGDMVTSGWRHEQWQPEFFEPLADVIDRVPIMVAIGNHDGDPEDVLRLFDLPGGRTWYSFDCGPVHVAVLDEDSSSPALLQWLDRDLASARAPWKIAAYHYPTFDAGAYYSDSSRRTLLPILERRGVDLVISGHSHLYERFKPLVRQGRLPRVAPPPFGDAVLVPEPDLPRQPITFVVTGGGGAPLYAVADHPLLARTAKTYHYCVVEADAESLRLRAITSAGKEIDSFVIAKKHGLYDESYLAQAEPMEWAFFSLGAMRLSTPRISALPQKEHLTVLQRVRFAGLTEPVTVTVRLAESSAADYEMEPVTVEVPPGKEAAVALKVRARSALSLVKDAADPRAEVLKPALRFDVSARSASYDETFQTGNVRKQVAGGRS